MPARTAFGRSFLCLFAMLLLALPVAPAFADEGACTLAIPEDAVEAQSPLVAEREQHGMKTMDASREAVSQTATHIATPERTLRAPEATKTVGEAPTTTGLLQTGDAFLEGAVVALGAVMVVAVSLLLYHFRKE